MGGDDNGLAEAVAWRREEALESESGFVGECREKVPFAEMFYVRSGGRELTSCTHNLNDLRRT